MDQNLHIMLRSAKTELNTNEIIKEDAMEYEIAKDDFLVPKSRKLSFESSKSYINERTLDKALVDTTSKRDYRKSIENLKNKEKNDSMRLIHSISSSNTSNTKQSSPALVIAKASEVDNNGQIHSLPTGKNNYRSIATNTSPKENLSSEKSVFQSKIANKTMSAPLSVVEVEEEATPVEVSTTTAPPTSLSDRNKSTAEFLSVNMQGKPKAPPLIWPSKNRTRTPQNPLNLTSANPKHIIQDNGYTRQWRRQIPKNKTNSMQLVSSSSFPNDIETYQEVNAMLTKDLRAANTKVSKLNAVIVALKRDLNNSRLDVKSKDSDINILKEQMIDLKKRMREKETRIQKQNLRKVSKIKSDNKRLHAELEKLKESIHMNETEEFYNFRSMKLDTLTTDILFQNNMFSSSNELGENPSQQSRGYDANDNNNYNHNHNPTSNKAKELIIHKSLHSSPADTPDVLMDELNAIECAMRGGGNSHKDGKPQQEPQLKSSSTCISSNGFVVNNSEIVRNNNKKRNVGDGEMTPRTTCATATTAGVISELPSSILDILFDDSITTNVNMENNELVVTIFNSKLGEKHKIPLHLMRQGIN